MFFGICLVYKNETQKKNGNEYQNRHTFNYTFHFRH